ncbi:MAG: pyridoxamine 5'-phosphate oxidase family protein [Tannerellaceae bacterium]|nr:pyridoxamine 5'-phosphate oxidase family protein [Tannerellaceae bacterium]
MEGHVTGGHPHGVMRRKEREITEAGELEAILREGKCMYLALSEGNKPFMVPVFYAYDGKAVYFHSAKGGTKIEILKGNNAVCFAVSLDQGIVESESACDFEARHRTVIGFGRAEFVEEEEAKVEALKRIVARFTDKQFEFPAANVKATAVIRIEIDLLKGKKHGM